MPRLAPHGPHNLITGEPPHILKLLLVHLDLPAPLRRGPFESGQGAGKSGIVWAATCVHFAVNAIMRLRGNGQGWLVRYAIEALSTTTPLSSATSRTMVSCEC